MNSIKEIFKEVPGYEGFYEASNMGRIFSKHGRHGGKFLKPTKNKRNKTCGVNLYKHGKGKKFTIPHVVLIAFVPNTNPKILKYAVCKDGNLENWSLDNLFWGSSAQSVVRKWTRHPELKDKLKLFKQGQKPPNTKMTEKMIFDLMEYRKLGYSARQLADIFPIKKSQAANIIKKYGDVLI